MLSFCLMISALLTSQTPASARGEDAEIAGQIAALSSPVFRIREDATLSLMERGTDILEPLRKAFQESRLFDTQRRIKEIAREVYLTEKLGPPAAFLGITHNRFDLRNVDDPRIPPGATALRIESIFPGTAAERAGLTPGDLLLALNDKRSTIEEPALNITKWIASQRPGTLCRFGIVRGGSGTRIEITPRQPINVTRLARIPVDVLQNKDNGLIPPDGVGLRLGEAVKLSDEVTLKRDDVIISLNDQPLPQGDPQGMLHAWISSVTKSGDNKPSEEMEVRIRNGQAQLVPRGAPSIQIVRGGAWMQIEARLGRRPSILRNSTPGTWQADPAAVEQASQAFETWWSDHVDPEGRFSEQAPGDLRWRMESSRR